MEFSCERTGLRSVLDLGAAQTSYIMLFYNVDLYHFCNKICAISEVSFSRK